MEEVGIELWLLIERLAKKSPSSLVKEVCFRTNEVPPNPMPTPAANSATAAKTAFRSTTAFANLKRRYQEGLEHQRLTVDANTVIAALQKAFPKGLSLSQSDTEAHILLAVRQLTEETIRRVAPKVDLARYPQMWEAFAKSLIGCSLSSASLVEQLDRFILTPHIVSERWWMEDIDGQSVVYRLTKVGMIKDPPTLELQYEVTSISALKSAKTLKGRRVIHLEEELQGSTPPAALALIGRRLAQSHGCLFQATEGMEENSMLRKTSADAEILKLLTKLHQLVKFGRIASPTAAHKNPMPNVSSVGTKPPFPPSRSTSVPQVAVDGGAPNKADIGLLYRDPEAALKNVDLNSADDYTVKEFKAKMSEGFASKVIKPGDPGYQYDKRVQMKPTGGSEWDDDD